MVKITIFVFTLSGEKQNDDEYALKAKRVSKERPTICTATAVLSAQIVDNFTVV